MPHPESGWREHAPPGTCLLAGLAPEQAQAVTHGTGPLLLTGARSDCGSRSGDHAARLKSASGSNG